MDVDSSSEKENAGIASSSATVDTKLSDQVDVDATNEHEQVQEVASSSSAAPAKSKTSSKRPNADDDECNERLRTQFREWLCQGFRFRYFRFRFNLKPKPGRPKIDSGLSMICGRTFNTPADRERPSHTLKTENRKKPRSSSTSSSLRLTAPCQADSPRSMAGRKRRKSFRASVGRMPSKMLLTRDSSTIGFSQGRSLDKDATLAKVLAAVIGIV